MFVYQIVSIALLSLAYSIFLLLFFGRFKKDKFLPLLLITPIVIFSVGYVFRLTGSKPMVDVGFFFTDSSYIFIYSLFTSALVIGQIKFWKK